MSLFADLMGKIFGHATPAASKTAEPSPSNVAASPAPSNAVTPTPTPVAPASVDVTAILDGLAAKSSESLDWKKSIVDLMKLVGMDSSLSARKQLATELHYTGDMGDSAAMNIWLHKEVMQKLADNGGKIPQELLH